MRSASMYSALLAITQAREVLRAATGRMPCDRRRFLFDGS